MKNLTVRNVSPSLSRALERHRKRSGQSLNQTVLELLERGLGVKREPTGNGLEDLAGTWTAEEADEFDAATAPFEQIDEELWR